MPPTEARPDQAVDAVCVRGARFRYESAPLFDGLDITLEAGRWTCLVGPSGVGKSSLLRVIASLSALDAGTVETMHAPLARHVAYMAQQDLLLPWLSALDNVLLGARLRGEAPDRARGRALLTSVGLGDALALRPAALSGGMRQRVALARTLMEDKPIVLMDEPFSALDAITRLRLQSLAAEHLAGRTVLLVTHDPLEALRLGHRIHIMLGQPARLADAAVPETPPPREPSDPALLQMHASLLAQLAAGDGALAAADPNG